MEAGTMTKRKRTRLGCGGGEKIPARIQARKEGGRQSYGLSREGMLREDKCGRERVARIRLRPRVASRVVERDSRMEEEKGNEGNGRVKGGRGKRARKRRRERKRISDEGARAGGRKGGTRRHRLDR